MPMERKGIVMSGRHYGFFLASLILPGLTWFSPENCLEEEMKVRLADLAADNILAARYDTLKWKYRQDYWS